MKSLPIVCTLTPGDLQERLALVRRLTAEAATLAFLAFLAMWFVQLAESKGMPEDRIPLSPPI